MSDDELVAWARGYVAGWERGETDGDRPEPPPADVDPAAIERGMWRKAWRDLVLAGVEPTEELIKERLWKLQT